jgi:hypothetical protein
VEGLEPKSSQITRIKDMNHQRLAPFSFSLHRNHSRTQSMSQVVECLRRMCQAPDSISSSEKKKIREQWTDVCNFEIH